MKHSNEGKACDAVMRRIEAREKASRRDVSSPERERHEHPVELVCKIGIKQFAFEHTLIEPFENFTTWQLKASQVFESVKRRLNGFLPAGEHFQLSVQAMFDLHLRSRELQRVQDAIVDWVRTIAPTLPIVRSSKNETPSNYTTFPGVPFRMFLVRTVKYGKLGQLSVQHLAEEISEQKRYERIVRAYNDKSEKLAAWQKKARSVLIFEENDPQHTNEIVVARAIVEVEKKATTKPDEIYLVSSAMGHYWWVHTVRVDDEYHILSQQSEISIEINSNILEDPRLEAS